MLRKRLNIPKENSVWCIKEARWQAVVCTDTNGFTNTPQTHQHSVSLDDEDVKTLQCAWTRADSKREKVDGQKFVILQKKSQAFERTEKKQHTKLTV